ncbi:MAG TPA: hypothetical protein VFG31_03820 [Conexibacter sp.]|nr:hypothetical protein [Conexibacter sp.]
MRPTEKQTPRNSNVIALLRPGKADATYPRSQEGEHAGRVAGALVAVLACVVAVRRRVKAVGRSAAARAGKRRFVAWKDAERDAARELVRPGGRLSARSQRAVEEHHTPAMTFARELRVRRLPVRRRQVASRDHSS